MSLSPGIARQLQTPPVVFPFLYLNRGEAFRSWLFGACIPCLIARVGYQISYPKKDTIQSWTVGTFLGKKQIDVVGVKTTKFTRESFFISWCVFLFGLGKATEQLDLSSTNKCSMLCETSSFLHTTLTNRRLCLVWVCLGQASVVTNSSFATNLKDPWWAGIAEEETSQETGQTIS